MAQEIPTQCTESQRQILSTPIIYGPVASRRLGRSLGINFFAPQDKVCTFNCVYCQCGKANTVKKGALSFDKIKKDIVDSFKKLVQLGTPINYITFAGNGEPTIHPDFPKIVDFVLEQRDNFFPETPTAIFTNCTMLNKSTIRQAIAKLDRRLLKLDASDKETMQRINQNANFETILNSIFKTAKEMPIEISTATIISPKKFANFDSIKSKVYIDIIKKINPIKVYLYSIDRPPAESEIKQVSREQLLELADYLRKYLKTSIQVLRSRRTRPWSQWIWE